jgi:hypothetical protein
MEDLPMPRRRRLAPLPAVLAFLLALALGAAPASGYSEDV